MATALGPAPGSSHHVSTQRNQPRWRGIPLQATFICFVLLAGTDTHLSTAALHARRRKSLCHLAHFSREIFRIHPIRALNCRCVPLGILNGQMCISALALSSRSLPIAHNLTNIFICKLMAMSTLDATEPSLKPFARQSVCVYVGNFVYPQSELQNGHHDMLPQYLHTKFLVCSHLE